MKFIVSSIADKYLNQYQTGRFNSKELGLIWLSVAAAHLLLAWMFHEPWSHLKKRPDLQIEFANPQVGTNSEKTVAPSATSAKATKKTESTPKANLPVSKEGVSKQVQADKAPSASSTSSQAQVGSNSAAQIAGVDTAVSSDNDRGPKLLNNPKPPYPSEAVKEGKEGKVYVNLQVLESGEVGEVQLFKSSGSPSLDESALKTVKQWKFSPGVKSGKVVAQWVRVPITFSLKNR